MGKNGNRHKSWSFDIFAIKMTHLNAFLSFLLSSNFSARSEAFWAWFKRVIAFGFPPLIRRSQLAYSICHFRNITTVILFRFYIRRITEPSVAPDCRSQKYSPNSYWNPRSDPLKVFDWGCGDLQCWCNFNTLMRWCCGVRYLCFI